VSRERTKRAARRARTALLATLAALSLAAIATAGTASASTTLAGVQADLAHQLQIAGSGSSAYVYDISA
jgi:ABC-type phosphate transport system substrate-binding protein